MPKLIIKISIRSGILYLSLLTVFIACEDETPQEPTAVQTAIVEITSGLVEIRQGDVVVYTSEARDVNGTIIDDPIFHWSIVPPTAGFFGEEGRFVGYTPGSATIVARAPPGIRDSLTINISPRALTGRFEVIGHTEIGTHFSTHISVNGNYAYTGTRRDRVIVWDITDPANPIRSADVELGPEITLINNVMVRSDGLIAAVGLQGESGGLVLLDLTNPGNPEVLITVDEGGLESGWGAAVGDGDHQSYGIHNLWIEGNLVYAGVDIFSSPELSKLYVIDISNLEDPKIIDTFYAGFSRTHDVHLRDGLAFISHWEAGLFIFDVSSMQSGDTLSNLKLLGSVQTEGRATHNAYYYPENDYVFVGEEGSTPATGVLYVIDASDLSNPHEVARYVDCCKGGTIFPSELPAHSFAMDEEAEILYVATWFGGVYALDVSGELMGRLDKQGRRIARMGATYGTGLSTAYSIKLHNDLLYVSAMRTGIWVLNLIR